MKKVHCWKINITNWLAEQVLIPDKNVDSVDDKNESQKNIFLTKK